MKKKHSIKTIADISKLMTKDNYKTLLSDIVESFYFVLEANEAIKDKTGEYPTYSIMDEIRWTNDGIGGIKEITVNGVKKKVKPLNDR